MTMPVLIQNHQKSTTVNRLKKSYAVLSQAIALSELENDSADYWNYTLPVDEFVNQYLINFLTVRETKVQNSGISYRYLNGQPCKEDLCTSTSYMMYLVDGSSLIISRHTGLNNGRVVMIDINGNKGPNIIGKDVFSFSIQQGVKVAPFGYGKFGTAWNDEGTDIKQAFGDYDRNVLTGNSAYACNKAKRGFWCAGLILSDGWQIAPDYPW